MPADFQYPPHTTNKRKRNIREYLWALRFDGPFEDQKYGRAATMLYETLKDRGSDISLNVTRQITSDFVPGGILHEVNGGHHEYVDRDVSGKRTTRFALGVNPDDAPFPANPFPAEPAQETPRKRRVRVDDPETAGEDPIKRLLQMSGVDEAAIEEELEVLEDAEDTEDLVQPEPTPETPEPDPVELAIPLSIPVPVVAPASTNGHVPQDDENTAADMILFAISILNQANFKLLTERINVEATASRQLIEDNRVLRSENETLKRERNLLAQQNQQLDQTVNTLQVELQNLRRQALAAVRR